jgi:hypothetical protein
MNNLTSNLNFLQQVSFRLTIDNANFTNLQYFCVSASLPGITMDGTETNYRNEVGYQPSGKIVYDTLSVKFMVDEDLANYTEVLKWMQANQRNVKNTYADLTLSILSAKNNVHRQFRFHDAFPISLSPIEFDTQATAIQYVPCTVVLRYNYFTSIK